MNPPELRMTDTNSGNDSSGSVWGIQGNLFYVFLIAALLSIILLLGLFAGVGLPFATATVVAAVPMILAIFYIVFRQTHPPGHDLDLLDQLLNGRGFSPRPYPDNSNDTF